MPFFLVRKRPLLPKVPILVLGEEEGKRIGIKMRAIETGGLSLAKQLVKPDLKRGEPCGRPGCVLDLTSGGAGGPHNIPSSLYKGECKLCEADGESAEYWGESGFSGSHRCDAHGAEVVARKEANAFAKPLAIFHQDDQETSQTLTYK